MDFKKYLIIFGLIIFAFSCGDKEKCYRTFNFEIPLKFYSETDTLVVGDTLWLDIDISSSCLKDAQSGDVFDTKGQLDTWFDLVLISFNQLIDSELIYEDQLPAVDKFEITSHIGEITASNNKYFYIDPQKTGDQHRLLVSIVPKEKGVYNILPIFWNEDVHNSIYKVDIIDDKCTEYFGDIRHPVNESPEDVYDTNVEVLKEHTKANYNIETALGWCSYTFVVE